MELNQLGLQQMWNLPVGATAMANDLMQQGMQYNNIKTNQAQEDLNHSQQFNPLMRQREQTAIDDSNVSRPGLAAIAQDRDMSLQKRKKLWEHELKSSFNEQHVKEMEDLGTFFLQNSALGGKNPFGLAQRVRGQLQKMGHDDVWNERWDSLPPDQLIKEWNALGGELQDATPKWRQQMKQLDAKGENRLAVKSLEQQEMNARAQASNMVRKELAAAKEVAKGSDKQAVLRTYQAKAAHWSEQSLILPEGTPAQRKADELAEFYNRAVFELAATTARAKAETEPNIKEMGIETNPPVKPPPLRATKPTTPVAGNTPAIKGTGTAEDPFDLD